MTRTSTTDASEGLTACADLVVTLEAPTASPTRPTLEGETTLGTFLLKQRRWLAAGAAASTHLYPISLASISGSSREAIIGLHWRLLIMALINDVANQAGNNAFGGGQRRPRSQLFIVFVLIGVQRSNPKQARVRQSITGRKGHFGRATQGG
jgi:hypothetical protein